MRLSCRHERERSPSLGWMCSFAYERNTEQSEGRFSCSSAWIRGKCSAIPGRWCICSFASSNAHACTPGRAADARGSRARPKKASASSTDTSDGASPFLSAVTSAPWLGLARGWVGARGTELEPEIAPEIAPAVRRSLYRRAPCSWIVRRTCQIWIEHAYSQRQSEPIRRHQRPSEAIRA